MRRRLAAAALLLIAACSRAPSGPPGTVAYSPRDGSYTAFLPAGWRVDDSAGGGHAAFFGPPGGPKPFAEMIAVSFFGAGSDYKDPRDYAAAKAALGKAAPPREIEVGGRHCLELDVERVIPDPHQGPQRVASRFVLMPSSGGFYALEHASPAAGPAPTAAFDDFLRSFAPGPGGK